jgi:two-component system, response regulator PdtaR
VVSFDPGLRLGLAQSANGFGGGADLVGWGFWVHASAKLGLSRRMQSEKSKGVVLVVEDEPLVRMVAVDTIQEAGYETVEASNADSAIRILESRKDIRIVFTDINMPGSMDGLKLAKAIRDRWPPIELILTSGFLKLRAHDVPERGVFLAKPYLPEALTEAIHRFDVAN